MHPIRQTGSPAVGIKLRSRFVFGLTLSVAAAFSVTSSAADSLLSTRMDWDAEKVFDSPYSHALCTAIEMGDIQLIDRLIADGADINARGMGNITPLLWAYNGSSEYGLEVFRHLLSIGADPNVQVSRRFSSRAPGVPQVLSRGHAVTFLAAGAPSRPWFDAVFGGSGNVNLVHASYQYTPLYFIISNSHNMLEVDRVDRTRILLDQGADPDHQCRRGFTPSMFAARDSQHGILATLLESGASVDLYDNDDRQLIHHTVLFWKAVHRDDAPISFSSETGEAAWLKVTEILQRHGYTHEEAAADLAQPPLQINSVPVPFLELRRMKRWDMGLDRDQPGVTDESEADASSPETEGQTPEDDLADPAADEADDDEPAQDRCP